jgi:hypothetical protein
MYWHEKISFEIFTWRIIMSRRNLYDNLGKGCIVCKWTRKSATGSQSNWGLLLSIWKGATNVGILTNYLWKESVHPFPFFRFCLLLLRHHFFLFLSYNITVAKNFLWLLDSRGSKNEIKEINSCISTHSCLMVLAIRNEKKQHFLPFFITSIIFHT